MPPFSMFVPLEQSMARAKLPASVVPVMTMFSATVMSPLSFNCPPVALLPVAAMVVVPAVLPSALPCVMASTPTLTFTAPSKSLLPLSVTVPLPVLVKPNTLAPSPMLLAMFKAAAPVLFVTDHV